MKKYWYKFLDKMCGYILSRLFEKCPFCLGQGFVYGYENTAVYYDYIAMSKRLKNWPFKSNFKIEQRECQQCKGTSLKLTFFGVRLIYLLKLMWDRVDVDVKENVPNEENEMKGLENIRFKETEKTKNVRKPRRPKTEWNNILK